MACELADSEIQIVLSIAARVISGCVDHMPECSSVLFIAPFHPFLKILATGTLPFDF
jgi:hypothetical protein